MNDGSATIVTPDADPARRKRVPRAALARLAFGSVPSSVAAHTLGPRHLAFLPPEALELDLDDPGQRRFGDYELLSKLGQGGMGVVYRARQRSLDREVAVKLLSAGPWASKDFIERFRREAQSAARMQHPNIVAIYEIGTHEELNFFSMRLVQGASLAHELQESGPLPPKRAAQLLRTIAEALDYAHRLGVLHLDLKPANVLIDERGEPQVADFGLARRLDETLTLDNDEVSGTPSYMAPEQAQLRSHPLSFATDIYGLGAILYELLAGRPPFLGASPHETLKRVIEDEPMRLRQFVPGLSPDLEAICLKCLSKQPRQRYPSARALAEDLGRYLDGRAVSVRPLNTLRRAGRWARREPRLAGSVAIAALLLVTGLVATTSQWRRAETNAGFARATAWSQRIDATWQNYARGEWLDALPRLVDNLREQEAAGAQSDARAERRRIGVLLAASPRLIDVVALGDPVMAVSVSPDGSRIAAVTRTAPATGRTEVSFALHLVDAQSGRVLWRRIALNEYPEFSADGRLLRTHWAVGGGSLGQPANGFLAMRLDAANGAMLPSPPGLDKARLLVYSRDGGVALLVTGDEMLQAWSTKPWRLLASGRRFAPEGRVLLSDDGSTYAYLSGQDRTRIDWFALDRDTASISLELPPGEFVKSARFSPEGRKLLLTTDAGRIALIDTRDGSERTLARNCDPGGYIPVPAFSEDGAWVAARCAHQRTSIWQVADGRMVSRPVQHAEEIDTMQVDRAHRMLFTQEFGSPHVYRLPPVEDATADAIPASPQLNSEAERNYYYANAFDAARGLLVFGTPDGRVKLWRLPPPTVMPVAAPPLETPDLAFDGQRVVAVDGSEVRVVDAAGAPLGPAMAHPQPVGFAFLASSGETVVTSSARELRAWDWRKGALRYPPLLLRNTPLRVLPTPDGAGVLTSTGEYREDRFEERLQLWRVSDGHALGEVAVPGPLYGARFSADGRRLLTWRGNALALRDSAGLDAPALTVTHVDAFGNAVRVCDARMIAPDEVHATTARRNVYYAAYYWRWNARDGSLREQLPLVGTSHSLALSASGAIAAYGWQHEAPRQFQRRHTGADFQWLPISHSKRYAPAIAYSADGRVLAQASLDGALLVDAASGAVLSPHLRATLAPGDTIVQFAFDDTARGLLGRTAFGRWLVWDVAPDSRAVASLQVERQLYAKHSGAGWMDSSDAVTAELRASLRARDPGAPRLQGTMSDPNDRFVARAPDTPDTLLDLGAWHMPVRNVDFASGWMFDLRSVPAGRQRFLDVEFDVRGLVQLKGDLKPPSPQPFPRRVDGMALPDRVLALDLLFGDYHHPDEELHPIMDVILRYRDGGERRIELAMRAGHHAYPDIAPDDGLGESASWRGARIAWLGRSRQAARMIHPPAPLYLMRVPNPEPERRLASLSLEARSAPYIVAITADVPPNH